MAYSPLNPNGQATMANSQPVVIASDQSTISVSGTVVTGGLTDAELRASPVVVSLTSTTITGTVAVTQSGAWTVTANAGTNLNTSLLALESGGNLAAIAASASVLDDWDESDRAKVNLIVGQAGIAAGTGIDGVTVPRVTLATNVALPAGTNVIGHVITDSGSVVTATLNAETTKVIGTVNQGTSPWVISLTSTTITGTVAVTQSTSPWIIAGGGTAGTAASGVVTVQGIASMTPVQVSQATASNLNATVVGTGTFAVQAAQSGTWNIGTVTTVSTVTAVTTLTNLGAGNAAATIAADGVTPTVPGIAAYGFIKTPGANTWDRHYSIVNATNSTGTGIAAVGLVGQFDDVSPTAITENQFGNLRMSANRNLYVTLRDAAGNERGVNIDSNNNLGTVLAAETSKVIGTIRIASGGVASGSFASGSIASGAIASGAVASGAFASGSIAAGAVAAGATSFVALEDDASANLDAGVKMLAVQKATPANTAGSDGDYEFIQMSAGRVWVNASGGRAALTASSPTSASVGTSSAQAVASNASRRGLILTNTSANIISLGIAATAVLNSGITLAPYAVWFMDEYSFATGAINAIASAASSNLAIQELT